MAFRTARRVAPRPTPPGLYLTACAVRARQAPSSNMHTLPMHALVRAVDMTVKPDLGIWFAARLAIRPRSIAGLLPTYCARRKCRLDHLASPTRTEAPEAAPARHGTEAACRVYAAAHVILAADTLVILLEADIVAMKQPPLQTARNLAMPSLERARPNLAWESRARRVRTACLGTGTAGMAGTAVTEGRLAWAAHVVPSPKW